MILSTPLVKFVSRIRDIKTSKPSSATTSKHSSAPSSVDQINSPKPLVTSAVHSQDAKNTPNTPAHLSNGYEMAPLASAHLSVEQRKANKVSASATQKPASPAQKTPHRGIFARWKKDWQREKTKTPTLPIKNDIEFEVPDFIEEGQFVWNENEMLGSGGMGVVFKGFIRTHGQTTPCAVKTVAKFDKRTGRHMTAYQNERVAYQRLDYHPRVATLMSTLETPGAVKFAIELAKCDLSHVLNGLSAPMSPARALHILAQVLDGLDHLHSSSLVHLDVKPANCLLRHSSDNSDDIYLADFGVSAVLNDEGVYYSQGVPGTLGYCAPEVLQRAALTPKADIFSAGILAFRLLADRPLITGLTTKNLVMSTLALNPLKVLMGGGWKWIGHGVEELLLSMLSSDPAARPSAYEALFFVQEAIDSMSYDGIDFSGRQASSECHTASIKLDNLVIPGSGPATSQQQPQRCRYAYTPRPVASASPAPSKVWWA